jgi:hypothetical protein
VTGKMLMYIEMRPVLLQDMALFISLYYNSIFMMTIKQLYFLIRLMWWLHQPT